MRVHDNVRGSLARGTSNGNTILNKCYLYMPCWKVQFAKRIQGIVEQKAKQHYSFISRLYKTVIKIRSSIYFDRLVFLSRVRCEIMRRIIS